MLTDVHLRVQRGEILGVVGQNGSGKSTLVKLLSGVFPADRGAVIAAEGHVLSNPPTPRELRDHGLRFVHQDLGLINELTVTENVCVGQYSPHHISRTIRRRRERDAAAETLSGLGSDINPDRLVSALQPGLRAVVAVARALHKLTPGRGCIVFDESTRSLPRELLPDFYALVRRLAVRGSGVVFISHHLGEVLTVADRVAVLRDGDLVAAALEPRKTSEAALASLMLGRELEQETRRPDRASAPAVHGTVARLRVLGLTTLDLKGIEFEAARGEIVGLTGASGSGLEDVPYAIAGALARARGQITIDGQAFSLPVPSVRPLLRAGIALVPQQRAAEGLALDVSAQDNLTLPRVADRSPWFLDSRWQSEEFSNATRTLGIVPRRPHMALSNFSGGNQQKVLLAKWLFSRPKLLLLHEPTQGVDVHSRLDILRSVRAAAASGMTVLLASIDSRDLALVCDRVLVLRNGEIDAELKGDLSAAAIETATYGAGTLEPSGERSG